MVSRRNDPTHVFFLREERGFRIRLCSHDHRTPNREQIVESARHRYLTERTANGTEIRNLIADLPDSKIVSLKSAGFPTDWDKANLRT
jgi:hypothetical protein